jgi:lipoyl(octanoyl) transferase
MNAPFTATPLTIDLGVMPYQAAWDKQLEIHTRVLEGDLPHGALLLVQHPPVITIGRRPGAQKHLLASPAMLQARGVELVETDRGGDITFHGPGQLVVYPILNLNAYNLNLHGYMRLLEAVVIATVAQFGVRALRVEGCTGVWIDPENALTKISDLAPQVPPQDPGPKTQDPRPKTQDPRPTPQDPAPAHQSPACSNHGLAKICAIGIKLRRWTTLHGLALNVTTDLSYFDLINPCGLSRPVTSLQKLLGKNTPPMDSVKAAVVAAFERELPPLTMLS